MTTKHLAAYVQGVGIGVVVGMSVPALGGRAIVGTAAFAAGLILLGCYYDRKATPDN